MNASGAGSTLIIGKSSYDVLTARSRTYTRMDPVREEAPIVRSKDPVPVTVWFHELRMSSQDVLLDPATLPGVKVGDVCEINANGRRLYFSVSKDTLHTLETGPKFQLLLLSSLQRTLDVLPRTVVHVRLVKRHAVEADSIEIFIKDVNLSRDLMWSFSSLLVESCVYVDQRLLYLGSRAGTVKYIYKDGAKLVSAYIGTNTRVVYRSESAKLTFLIQLSREMWHFEENGEIMFHKLVNTLLPKIFKKWRHKSTHHSITIVLFTSIDLTNIPWTSLGQGERPHNRKDFFRVVVDQVNVFHWDKIMANLRLEFANFKRDVMLHLSPTTNIVDGEVLPAVKGNILEAVNMGLSLVIDRFRNTDLKHCLSHFVLITPGTGLFDVDHSLMLETSKKMHFLDVALDLVCLSQPPLHKVPLFRYRNPDRGGLVCHCVPNWCDISFYKGTSDLSQWIPRCKIYELQMMGVMEYDVSEVHINRLALLSEKLAVTMMNRYDDELFKSMDEKPAVRPPAKPLSPLDKVTLSLISGGTASTAKSDTTQSLVLGTVSGVHETALSSLYHLNKDGTRPVSATPTLRTVVSNRTFVSKSELVPEKKPRKRDDKKKASVVAAPAPVNEIPHEFWTEIINPSKELHSDSLEFIRLSRWQDVFPPKIRRKQVKWRSFQSPAALPSVTSRFPSKEALEKDYLIQNYTVTLNWENSFDIETNQGLMREMMSLRLALGFQVLHGEDVNAVDGGKPEDILKYCPRGTFARARIYLGLDDEIHRLLMEDNAIYVLLYKKHPRQKPETTFGLREPEGYDPLIRTRYADDYTPAQVDIIDSKPIKYNWNQFDQYLAGYDEAMPEENRNFYKMKFVVMPAEIPKNAYHINNEHLSDEEIRLEGLRKLIATIERGKYVRTEDRKHRKKEEILPEITFYTGNLYDFLNDQAEAYELTGNQPHNSLMLSEGARFNREIKLQQLAVELQKPEGVRLIDRTWHFKTHLHCFLGNELVSWLIESFEDIDLRETATDYGQSLMDKGLFRHVNNRHGFLDGYYFYELEDEYADKLSRSEKSSWFNRKKLDGDSSRLPSTTAASPALAAHSETSSVNDKLRKSKKFILSRRVKYDTDPLRKSHRAEAIYVHYDRVHNPEHCYHIRLQWLNTTTKFVDEAIISWLRLCERYGLKLVETPWKELCTIPRFNPFHSFVDLKLSINPWLDPEFADPKILRDNKFYYHLYFLRKSSFLLDNRSSIFFSRDNIEISYSWGKPIFQYAQYIHETGAYIVELRDNGDFFLAPNNIHIIRVNTSLNSNSDDSTVKNYNLDSQKIMLQFRLACSDREILRAIFREARDNWTADVHAIADI